MAAAVTEPTKLTGFKRTAEVDVRTSLPYEEFVRDYLMPAKPVLLKNAFPQWRALGKWTPEFFKRQHGHRQILVAGVAMTMAEFIDGVVSSTPDKPSPYLRELCIRNFAPELGEDLMPFVMYALPNWLRGVYVDPEVNKKLNRASEVELFIGGMGTRLERRKGEQDPRFQGLGGERIEGFVDLHYDPTACPVMLCQIYGHKEWTLFSPSDTPHLYTTGRHSAVPNLDDPDFERFPDLRNATPYRFVQEPGDAVYCPPFWWHATKMKSVSIAVGTTFANFAHWNGVIDDVVEHVAAGAPLRGKIIRANMRADGMAKKLGGPRLGEKTHFQDPINKKAINAARKTAKRILGRA